MATGTTLAIIYCVTGSWLRWRQGYQPAALLLIGWFLLGTGILLTLLNFLFWGHPYLNWALIVGYALELLFFSLAIQQKARLSEQKTIRAHEHAFLQLQKVFYPHQIERMKEGAQLETTMPTGPADACVLAFDVVASSRLPSEHAKGFLEEALKSSLALLSQDYDPKTLSARGYRIKEMGDGFLCSVGYPFASPGHQRNEEAAVKLALDMITVFESVVQKHFGDHRVFCAIGIASERLESFFPKAGTVEYDVYGRAIVLATRYESARNVLFREGIQGHVIILHSKVYRALPASLRDSFSRVDLSEQKFKIRDDEQATELAYRVFP
jgi:class 3 adenylate cyclase